MTAEEIYEFSRAGLLNVHLLFWFIPSLVVLTPPLPYSIRNLLVRYLYTIVVMWGCLVLITLFVSSPLISIHPDTIYESLYANGIAMHFGWVFLMFTALPAVLIVYLLQKFKIIKETPNKAVVPTPES